MATTPAKVILLGEHAVVYGQPALAVPVTALETRATVWSSNSALAIHAHLALVKDHLERSIVVAESTTDDALVTAVRATLAATGVSGLPDWSIEVASTVPLGRGLGASAAVAVALVRAVARAAGQELGDAAASALALEAERVAHGNPSGIDNTVVAFGRPIHFQAGLARPLAIRAPLSLVIADSGLPSATADMVAAVHRRHAENPAAHEAWFSQIGRLVSEATVALEQGDLRRLGRLMNSNHLLLQALAVSTPGLDRLVGAARTAGALGAKLSGAGGGGIVVALATAETAADIARALAEGGATQVLRSLVESGP